MVRLRVWIPPGNTPAVAPFHSNYRTALDVGAIAAAGVRFQAGRIKFLPEIRYTRYSEANSFYRKNQVKFLMGITF